MQKMFKDKKILITGGTGSIGKEIVRALILLNPETIRIFDINENSQFEFQQELEEYDNIRYFLGDLRDKERLCRAIEDVDIIYHTAGLKHVHACEYNPFEAVKTNVIGTQNLIEAAMIEEGVEKVIFTSSDKAVNPSSTMGASKLLAEKLIITANYYRGDRRKTAFSCVRFGNVLGSSGSIIPLFINQIKKGGPVTITDNEMTRFIISMGDAIDLIFKATELSHGGEIFLTKMLALRVTDIAEVIIEKLAPKYGIKPEGIEIKKIGIKPGEKLFEELMTEDEAKRALEVGDLLIIAPELKKYANFDASNYPDAKPTKLISLNSKDTELLDKKEIMELLMKENLA